jgi:outer membrane protein assembly factor BamB
MTRILLATAAVVLPALAALAAPTKPGDKDATAAVPFFGGVADVEGKRGYVPSADGGVDALDLETGKVLWNSKDATQPLARIARNLIALKPAKNKTNAVVVVVMDADEGKVASESEAVVFPDWVSVGLAHGRSFAAKGRVVDGDLWLRWQARAWYAGGARPTPAIEKAARKNADGAARVDLKTGKVEMLDADKMPPEPGPKLSDDLIKAASRPRFDPFGETRRVETCGKLAVAIDVKDNKLTLSRWDIETGKALDPVALLEAPSFSWQVVPEAGYLLAHKAVAKERLPEGDNAWWVFDLQTGKEIAKFGHEDGTESATVVGPRAFYVVLGQSRKPGDFTQPRTLKAVDLKTGKALWEHQIEPRRMLPPLP